MKITSMVSNGVAEMDIEATVLNGEDCKCISISDRLYLILTNEQAAALAKALNGVYRLMIHGYGSRKIEAIKWVREVSGLGLKEAKDLVEASELRSQVVKEFPTHDAAHKVYCDAPYFPERTAESANWGYAPVPSYNLRDFLSVEPA